MKGLLEGIELKVSGKQVEIPTFRPDLRIVADLAEEIARLHGLENIHPRPVFPIDYNIQINEFDQFIDQLKNILTGFGLQEVITSSMVNSHLWEKITGHQMYPILNPISKDLDGLRHSLLPSLAQIIQYNRNRKCSDLKIFEINRIFRAKSDTHSLPEEEVHLAICLTGLREPNLWNSSHQTHDFYDIKGFVEILCHKIFLDNWQFISYSDPVIQEAGLAIQAHEKMIGFLGTLSQKIARDFDIEEDIFIADLNVRGLFDLRKPEKKYSPIPRYPGIERDVALIVDEDLEAKKIIRNLTEVSGNLLYRLELFDIYRGRQIPEGKKSLAFRLTFQSNARTLTEEEINNLMSEIYTSVQKNFQAKLRE